jgi:hypothetical protein
MRMRRRREIRLRLLLGCLLVACSGADHPAVGPDLGAAPDLAARPDQGASDAAREDSGRIPLPDAGDRLDASADLPPADTTPPSFARLGRWAEALGPRRVRLRWDPAQDDRTAADELRYPVYLGLASGGPSFAAPRTVAGPGVTEVVLEDLEPATAYICVVRARDAAGNEDDNLERLAFSTPAPPRPLEITVIYGSEVSGNLEPCG